MNVRVEYDHQTPIKHIAIQCPKCKRWFNGKDITKDSLNYEYQIYNAQFTCPICSKVFCGDWNIGYEDVHIEEIEYPQVYKDCVHKKEVWE